MGIMLGKTPKLGNNYLVNEYVDTSDNVYRIAGSRVSLDSIVYAFRRGASPESIQRSFPTITLEAVYGAIAYYLANQDEVDAYLAEGDSEFADLQDKSRSNHRDWYARLQAAKKESPVS